MPTQKIELRLKSALLPNGWAEDVVLSIDVNGNVADIKPGAAIGATGHLVSGLANLHSHAHQRAMAGLAERAGSTNDSFWTWRKTMYQFLDAMQPYHLHAIAKQLYSEMLSAGYTRVAEFQYLHHQTNGDHYDNIAEMSLQTLRAATEVGIGITNLPVHYQFGGFGEQVISEQQRRFYNEPDSFLRIVETLQAAATGNANVNLGVAGHSLRATNNESFSKVLDGAAGLNITPVHMHIAEQLKEVDDCLNWSGARPVDYCLDNFNVDESWCLIHATQMSDTETLRLATSGAVAGLCPTTEANLGDGFFNATDFLNAGGKIGIGSDSHISSSPVEELRWLEYGQRLVHKTRNQLAGGSDRSTGRNLFDLAVTGGAQACAHNAGAIEIGQRADFVVLDCEHPLLIARRGDEILDSWIFAGNLNSVRDVYVGGEHVIQNGMHRNQAQISEDFRKTMHELKAAN